MCHCVIYSYGKGEMVRIAWGPRPHEDKVGQQCRAGGASLACNKPDAPLPQKKKGKQELPSKSTPPVRQVGETMGWKAAPSASPTPGSFQGNYSLKKKFFFNCCSSTVVTISPHQSSHPSHPHLPPLILPLFGFVHVSFIHVPENPSPLSPHYPFPPHLRSLSVCS